MRCFQFLLDTNRKKSKSDDFLELTSEEIEDQTREVKNELLVLQCGPYSMNVVALNTNALSTP